MKSSWNEDFEKINYLPVCERFNQYLFSNGFKIFKETFLPVKNKQIRDLLF